jgi:hypothetical protein
VEGGERVGVWYKLCVMPLKRCSSATTLEREGVGEEGEEDVA